jgi:predicted nucleic acid-binding protein
LQQSLNDKIEIAVTPQILREFAVSSLRAFKDPFQAPYDQIIANVEQFREVFEVLPENSWTVQELGRLVRQFQVYGKNVHDANIVAVMRVHGITDC